MKRSENEEKDGKEPEFNWNRIKIIFFFAIRYVKKGQNFKVIIEVV